MQAGSFEDRLPCGILAYCFTVPYSLGKRSLSSAVPRAGPVPLEITRRHSRSRRFPEIMSFDRAVTARGQLHAARAPLEQTRPDNER
jgi:hypothetical protein